jgi:hypothetical protein
MKGKSGRNPRNKERHDRAAVSITPIGMNSWHTDVRRTNIPVRRCTVDPIVIISIAVGSRGITVIVVLVSGIFVLWLFVIAARFRLNRSQEERCSKDQDNSQ